MQHEVREYSFRIYWSLKMAFFRAIKICVTRFGFKNQIRRNNMAGYSAKRNFKKVSIKMRFFFFFTSIFYIFKFVSNAYFLNLFTSFNVIPTLMIFIIKGYSNAPGNICVLQTKRNNFLQVLRIFLLHIPFINAGIV